MSTSLFLSCIAALVIALVILMIGTLTWYAGYASGQGDKRRQDDAAFHRFIEALGMLAELQGSRVSLSVYKQALRDALAWALGITDEQPQHKTEHDEVTHA